MTNKKELNTSEILELMETANKAANIGVFQFDVETHQIYWSDLLKSIFEVAEDFEPTVETLIEFIQNCENPKQIQNLYCNALENRKAFNIEHEVTTAKGNKKILWFFGQPIFKNGKYYCFQGAAMDITERKKSELEIIQKNQYLNLIEEKNKMGYWRWNPIQNIATCSNNVYKIIEQEKNIDLNYNSYLKFIHPDDTSFFEQKIEDSVLNKIISPFYHRIILKNGNIKTILITGEVITNENGKVIEMVGTYQDITEDKAKEEELADRKQQQSISEKMTIGGTFQYNYSTKEFRWSDNLHRIFKFPFDKKVELDTLLHYTHPDDQLFVTSIIKEIWETGKAQTFTHRIILDNEEERIIEITAELSINLPKNYNTKLIGSVQDITSRIITNKTLKKKNQLLNFAEQITTVGFWSWRPGSDTVFWSDNLYDIFGKSKNETPTSNTYFSCVHPDDKDYVYETIKASIENLKFKNFSHRILCHQGTLKTIQIVGEITSNRKGRHIELTGTCLDITESELKTAQLELKNQQLSIAEKMAMIGNWHWNFKTNEIKWSDNLYTIYEHDKNAPTTLETYLKYIHEDDKNYVNSIFEETLRTKKFINSTYRIQLKNGTIKVLNSIGKIITNNNGDIVEIIGTCQDITKSKADKLQLLHKNQSLSFAEKITKIGNWKWDVKTNTFEWSDNLYEIIGFEKGSTITKERYLTNVPVDEQERWLKHVDEALKSKTFKKFTHHIIKPDNTLITLEVNGKVLTDNQGDITAIFGTSQDITEREKKELELIEKNQQLNLAEEIANIGYWVLNLETQKFDWSDNTYRIFDFDIGTPMYLDILLSRVPIEEHVSIKEKINTFIKTKKFKKFTHGLKHNNKSLRTIEVVGKVITNEQNEAIEFVGSSRDITEELKIQEKILATNKSLEESAIKLSAQNKQLAEFNQISSHNLRAPVGNLKALLSLYNDSENQDERKEIFSKFETVIDHLSLTLDTLVESLKIKNIPNKDVQKLFFKDTLTKTKEILTAEILKTGAIIKSDFSIKNYVKYNQIYLESIFLNLIGNAIKYRSPERTPKINITSDIIDNKVILRIKDNGLGIDLKKHGHKLFGLNKVFHRHPEAQGIGLFLTKAQIETMGGSIYAESEVNTGTTFHIILN